MTTTLCDTCNEPANDREFIVEFDAGDEQTRMVRIWAADKRSAVAKLNDHAEYGGSVLVDIYESTGDTD